MCFCLARDGGNEHEVSEPATFYAYALDVGATGGTESEPDGTAEGSQTQPDA